MANAQPFYHTYVENRFALENAFGARLCQPWPWAYVNQKHPPGQLELPVGTRGRAWPDLEAMRGRLPRPYWQGHDEVIACYDKVWEIAARNRRRATLDNRFCSDYCSTAFNGNTFMWDSAFIALFGRYGVRAWAFQGTCDNFYAKQHPDGFICREIGETDGEDRFQRFDPSATGPNALPWSEWEYWLFSGDRARLARVFPPLMAFTDWMRTNRTWPDGSYWASGWASGMDNQPRFPGFYPDKGPHDPEGFHETYEHAHATWLDTTLQAVFADQLLLRMATVLGRETEVGRCRAEIAQLTRLLNERMWDEDAGFYHDLDRQGKRSAMKGVGAYWALLAGVVPPERLPRFLAHLDDPKAFKRPHRVPSISADSAGYEPGGGYWRGGVWAPTNYMVLRGLTQSGADDLAADIGRNHLDAVVAGFVSTGTLWENYAPESVGAQSDFHSTKDFVGWTGLVPTAVLFEYVFGLRPDVPAGRLVWDVRLSEAFGVERYPFGTKGTLRLSCAARASTTDEPRVTVDGDVPVEVELRWAGGRKVLRCG